MERRRPMFQRRLEHSINILHREGIIPFNRQIFQETVTGIRLTCEGQINPTTFNLKLTVLSAKDFTIMPPPELVKILQNL